MIQYFKQHYMLSFWLQMASVGIGLLLGLLSVTVCPSIPYWIIPLFLIPAIFFRVLWDKGYYAAHPERDKYSDQYVPAKERKKMKEQNQK